MKIDVDQLLRTTDEKTRGMVAHAMAEGATPLDVTTAAIAVRYAGALRRKCEASSAAHEDVEAEYLTGLSLRLMEIDEGRDLGATAAAAAVLSGKPVQGI